MRLYTCQAGYLDVPGPFDVHPCAKALKALDRAGHQYERRVLEGRSLMPWTVTDERRAEVIELSGQRLLPVLVLDDGTVIHGSGKIAAWAKEHPAT